MTAPIPARGPKLRLHHAIDVDRQVQPGIMQSNSAARCTKWDNEYTFWDTIAYDVRVESITRCGRSKLNNLGVGLTLGYQVNDRLQGSIVGVRERGERTLAPFTSSHSRWNSLNVGFRDFRLAGALWNIVRSAFTPVLAGVRFRTIRCQELAERAHRPTATERPVSRHCTHTCRTRDRRQAIDCRRRSPR